MENRGKKIFLLLSITIPFLIYCIYYYGVMIKNAPYKFSEFDHISLQYGTPDSLLNKYNSKTGDYQYLTVHDSLVKTHLTVGQNNLLYLHRKAADLGYWDFPSNERGDTVKTKTNKPVRYIIEFGYKRKTKTVVFDSNFDGNPKLIDANQRLIREIQQVINDTQEKSSKK
jgi:hypothetical protein